MHTINSTLINTQSFREIHSLLSSSALVNAKALAELTIRSYREYFDISTIFSDSLKLQAVLMKTEITPYLAIIGI